MRICRAVIPLSLALLACRQEVVGAPEVPEAVREQEPDEDAAPTPDVEPAAAPDTAVIDLTEFGLKAELAADGNVEAHATDDGVRLETDEGFALFVGRGSLDMTGEREELVRAYGTRFERFIKDSPDVVAWELSSPTGSTYHFFASFEGPLSYHCRSLPEGADSPQLIDTMLEVCRSVRSAEDEG